MFLELTLSSSSTLQHHIFGGESQNKRMLVGSIFNAFKLRGPRAAGVLKAAISSSGIAHASTGMLARAFCVIDHDHSTRRACALRRGTDRAPDHDSPTSKAPERLNT